MIGGDTMALKIAVKELACFVCQSGDLTNEFFSNKELEQGTRLHRYLQSKYNADSKSEVFIKKEFTYQRKEIILNGFIDGVLQQNGDTIIEEIKSTTQELDELDVEKRKEYLAQLKIYGYLYGLENDINPIHLRLTYISTIDYEIKSVDYVLSLEELEKFTFTVLEEYLIWINLLEEASIKREKTIQSVKFPFEKMRQGQRDMMKACFQAMKQQDILYIVAPTGIGKTMAALFSTLKTLEEKDKLFYLTAKGSGKTAPLQAVKLLAEQGLKIKTINLTAKKKICNAKLKNCKPEECPFAVGFFDRLKDATYDIFKKYDIYDEDVISKIANKHRICAFEFSLYLSYFCDIVIADYNYVFDPRAHLIRYFEDDTYRPKVLVDEAHNLISRGKEMFSASITEADISSLRKALNGIKPSIRTECNQLLDRIGSYREHLALKAIYVNTFNDTDLLVLVKSVLSKCDTIFQENKHIPHKDDALDSYFKLMDYVLISEYYGATHRFIAKINQDEVEIQLMCLDASDFILDMIKSSIKGIVFFSATLTPFTYHADLITKGEGKFLELASPFPPENLDIIINSRVSTKYKQREQSIDYILEAIETLTKVKSGNYIVFFPSYQYLNMVVSSLGEVDYKILVQKSDFTENERLEMIESFKNTKDCKVGFFVMGGVFSEGIDFIGDWLSGVIIVGVGLPMICDENNILKDYFEELYQNGFDYAYTYPGFTKVVQSVGRVIRSETDRGVVILIDERFGSYKYQGLMPKHWQNKKMISNAYELKKELEAFYKK